MCTVVNVCLSPDEHEISPKLMVHWSVGARDLCSVQQMAVIICRGREE